ncbi:MAG: hypothetical protein ACXACU_05075, partial [Candidatus Hodarchaeales archaeon]
NLPLTISSYSDSVSFLTDKPTSKNLDYYVETEHNLYTPSGNSSVLIAIDSNLLGPDEYFENDLTVIESFETWFQPFEKKFNIDFHVKNITTFSPTINDSLDDSIIKVPDQLGWNLSSKINDPLVNGNGHDWLIVYQEYYRQGRNRVNAINGNALIIAHYQPLDWTSRQLILLHEIGHLFGAVHFEDGFIPQSWYYEGENKSIMSYDDLVTLNLDGWDKSNMSIDEHNFELINQSKYRFDLTDADMDGLPNYYEYRHGLNPNYDDSESDSDNDGLSNILEFTHGTNPNNGDSDSDSYSDWAEIFSSSNPMNSSVFPSIYIPIVLAWTEDLTIKANIEFNLEWRGLSSNRDYYEIYKNNTILTRNDWSKELITYTGKESTGPNWNFTCLVADQSGNIARASIFIRIITSQNTPLGILEIIVAVFLIGLIATKKLFRKIRLNRGYR